MPYHLRNFPSSYTLIANIFVAILYIVIGELGLLLAIPQTTVAPIWPAAGLALAATLIFGYRILPAIVLGSLIMNFFALLALNHSAPIGKVFLVSMLTGMGAALQAFAATAAIKCAINLQDFFHYPSIVMTFLGIGAISCVISSTIGVSSLAIAGFIPWSLAPTSWLAWFLGDTSGVVVVAPLILSWIRVSIRNLTMAKIIEAVILLLVITVITVFMHTVYTTRTFRTPLLYLYLPCLIWAACRFSFPGATLAMLITVFFVTLITASNFGPFAIQTSTTEALLSVALFITVVTATILALTAELSKAKDEKIVWKGEPLSVSQRFLNWWNSRKRK